MKEELVDFLKIFYSDMHGNDETETDFILKELEENESNWRAIAQKKSYQNYQLNEYDHRLLYLEKGNRIEVRFSSIILVMEGKIIMETYGRQFRFFEKLIKKTYSDFKLANAIVVGITS